MKTTVLLVFLLCPVAAYSAETEAPPAKTEESPTQTEETNLYNHYLSLKRMEESLGSRTIDDQARLQPQIQRAQRLACEKLQRDHRERVPKEEYRRQGGDEFLVFAWQLEFYCQTSR